MAAPRHDRVMRLMGAGAMGAKNTELDMCLLQSLGLLVHWKDYKKFRVLFAVERHDIIPFFGVTSTPDEFREVSDINPLIPHFP